MVIVVNSHLMAMVKIISDLPVHWCHSLVNCRPAVLVRQLKLLV